MRLRAQRIVSFAIATVAGALLGHPSWISNARAQSAPAPGQTVEVPASQLEQIQKELKYLRARDAQRQDWEVSVSQRLPDKMMTVDPDAIDGAATIPEAGLAVPSEDCGCDPTGCGCPRCMNTPWAPGIDCPRVTTLNPYFNLRLFGAVRLDMIFNDPRPQAPGVPFYLVPASPTGLPQNTVDIHARQTKLGAALAGPMVGNFQTGGVVAAVLFDNNVLNDQYGLLPLEAYGELKNDNWRFTAGLQGDVFAPGAPTVLPFSALGASGNVGNSWRGSVRGERYVNFDSDSQMIFQGCLSEPITTVVSPDFNLSEDNGWPNIEGRVAWGYGEVQPIGLLNMRPVQIGFSGVAGQLRRTSPDSTRRVVADVWGTALDFRVNMFSRMGFAGELYTGQGLGTYNGAILQTVDDITWQPIRSTGGWLEGFFYWTPCLHSHAGYAIDDPNNNDITGIPNSLAGRTYNSTAYTNLLWDVNQTFRLGFEVAYRRTEYKDPTSLANEGANYHAQAQWSF